jgi:hypothetical protein
MAATAAGSWAVPSVTVPPLAFDSAAMIQGKRGGLLRYCCPSTAAVNHAPRSTMSRASNAKRASSDFTIRW